MEKYCEIDEHLSILNTEWLSQVYPKELIAATAEMSLFSD